MFWILLQIVLYWIGLFVTIWCLMLTGLGLANLCAITTDWVRKAVLPKSG